MEGNNNFNQNQYQANQTNNFNQNQYQANQTNNFNQEPIYQSNQVLEKKEGSNKILVVALVMSFIAVIALAYFYTDIKNEYIALKAEQVNNPSSCVKPEEDADKKEIKVEELTHIVTEKDENGKRYADIKVPTITGNTNNIKVLNKKILENLFSYVLSYNEAYKDDGWDNEDREYPGIFYRGEYKYIIKNNVIILVTKIHDSSWATTGDGFYKEIYVYDIDSDQEIKLYDALVKIGYTDADFQKLADKGQCYELTADGNDEYEIPCTIDIVKEELGAGTDRSQTTFDINENNEIEIEIKRASMKL